MQLSAVLTLPVLCILTLFFTTIVHSARNYYDILGVPKQATEREIKRAFRKLAVKYHPDKNKDPDAEKQFVKIGKAYEILSDPEKRKQYDQLGHQRFEEQETRGGSGGGGGFGGFNFNDFFKQFDESLRSHRTRNSGGSHNKYSRKNNEQFLFGNDFWDDLEDINLFGDLGGGFGGFGGGDAFINLQNFGFGDAFGGNPGHNAHHHGGNLHPSGHRKEARSSSTAGRCKTVTKRIGNTITTYTDCS